MQGVHHTVQALAGNTERIRRPESHANENSVELRFHPFDRHVGADIGVLAELHPRRPHQVGFLDALGGRELVLGHTVGIQSAGHLALIEDGNAIAQSPQFRRASQRSRPRADAGNPSFPRRAHRQPDVARVEVFHRVPLQPAHFHRPGMMTMQHTGPLAQHVHRAHARATQPKDIGIEYGPRRAAEITGGDLPDESGHVDVSRTRLGAGSVETIEAAVGFLQRFGARQRRMQFSEAPGEVPSVRRFPPCLHVPPPLQNLGSGHFLYHVCETADTVRKCHFVIK